MILSSNCSRYILYQRTSYADDTAIGSLLSRIADRFPSLYPFSVWLKSRLFSSHILERYTRGMQEEFDVLLPFLPPTATAILDIGCGIAGIDVLLAQHYRNSSVYLIDKSTVDPSIYYGFHETGSFYNSLQLAKETLMRNGVQKVFTQEAQENKILFEEKFDVVLSLLSWGFHYPVLTYLDEVYAKLLPHGVLILDICKGTGGEHEIRKKFGQYTVLMETKWSLRIQTSKNS